MKAIKRAGALLIGLSLIAAACSDDKKADSTTTTAAASTTVPAPESTEATGGDSLADKIAGYAERPTQIPVTEKIDAEIPTGKRIAGFVCPLPACQDLADSATEAAKALGWEYIKIPMGFSPDEIVTAWEQAIREKPDGILALSTEQALYQSQLDKAKAAGIAVISMLVSSDGAQGGMDAVLWDASWMRRIGSDMADWVAVDSNADASTKTVLIYSPQLTILAQQADAFAEEYAAVCADCKLDRLEVPATAIGSDLTTRITGYLRANPDVNYAWVGYDDMIRGLPAALEASNIKGVKVFSNGGQLSPESAAYLAEDKAIQMIYDYGGLEVTWRGMDWFARHFAGVSTAPSEDTSNDAVWMVGPTTAPEGGSGFLVADYAAQYKALWGVS